MLKIPLILLNKENNTIDIIEDGLNVLKNIEKHIISVCFLGLEDLIPTFLSTSEVQSVPPLTTTGLWIYVDKNYMKNGITSSKNDFLYLSCQLSSSDSFPQLQLEQFFSVLLLLTNVIIHNRKESFPFELLAQAFDALQKQQETHEQFFVPSLFIDLVTDDSSNKTIETRASFIRMFSQYEEINLLKHKNINKAIKAIELLVKQQARKIFFLIPLFGNIFYYFLKENFMQTKNKNEMIDIKELWIISFELYSKTVFEIARKNFQKSLENSNLNMPCSLEQIFLTHKDAKKEAMEKLENLKKINSPISDEQLSNFNKELKLLRKKDINRNEELTEEYNTNLLKRIQKERQLHVEEQEVNLLESSDEILSVFQLKLKEVLDEYEVSCYKETKEKALSLYLHNVSCKSLVQVFELLSKCSKKDIEDYQKQKTLKEEALQELSSETEKGRESIKQIQLSSQEKLQCSSLEYQEKKQSLINSLKEIEVKLSDEQRSHDFLQKEAFALVEAANDSLESNEENLEGYLLKKSAKNGRNPFGRNSWKQRYFVLNNNILVYAKTRDDYERGKIIKEISLQGCSISNCNEAGEGFLISPPEDINFTRSSSSHVIKRKVSMFFAPSEDDSSSDRDRVFRLHAPTIEKRKEWVQRLTKASLIVSSRVSIDE